MADTLFDIGPEMTIGALSPWAGAQAEETAIALYGRLSRMLMHEGLFHPENPRRE